MGDWEPLEMRPAEEVGPWEYPIRAHALLDLYFSVGQSERLPIHHTDLQPTSLLSTQNQVTRAEP